jgi:hypothetical protein
MLSARSDRGTRAISRRRFNGVLDRNARRRVEEVKPAGVRNQAQRGSLSRRRLRMDACYEDRALIANGLDELARCGRGVCRGGDGKSGRALAAGAPQPELWSTRDRDRAPSTPAVGVGACGTRTTCGDGTSWARRRSAGPGLSARGRYETPVDALDEQAELTQPPRRSSWGGRRRDLAEESTRTRGPRGRCSMVPIDGEQVELNEMAAFSMPV